MQFLKRFRGPIIAGAVVVLVVAFLAFRPDKLFVDDAVDESLEDAFAASEVPTANTPATSTPPAPTESTPEASEPEEASITTSPPPPPSGPVVVGSGSFYGIDHSAVGTATVYEQEGRYVLRLEDDTDIQNGPDLYVWVLESADYEGGDPEVYLDLGKIKGNVGGQNYELPAGFDPEVHQAVLIWCLRFGVPFAAAPLG